MHSRQRHRWRAGLAQHACVLINRVLISAMGCDHGVNLGPAEFPPEQHIRPLHRRGGLHPAIINPGFICARMAKIGMRKGNAQIDDRQNNLGRTTIQGGIIWRVRQFFLFKTGVDRILPHRQVQPQLRPLSKGTTGIDRWRNKERLNFGPAAFQQWLL